LKKNVRILWDRKKERRERKSGATSKGKEELCTSRGFHAYDLDGSTKTNLGGKKKEKKKKKKKTKKKWGERKTVDQGGRV